ncbi:uncharacterized protein LOC144443757 [Glandiceps talaboti]
MASSPEDSETKVNNDDHVDTLDTPDSSVDQKQENGSNSASSADGNDIQEKDDDGSSKDPNPDEVCRQLENMDLTEEETEELLQDALELNKKLKDELKRQERARSARSGRSRTRSTPDEARPGSGRYGVLPPIKKGSVTADQSKLYGSKLTPSKSGKTPQQRKPSSTSKDRPTAASAGSLRQSSGKDDRGSARKEKGKPEWNDRFSYA